MAQDGHDLVAPAFMSLAGMTSGAAVTVLTAIWAEVYGLGHLGAIRALAASLAVVSSALGPAAMGRLIDGGVSIEVIALGSAAYLTCAGLGTVTAFLLPRRGACKSWLTTVRDRGATKPRPSSLYSDDVTAGCRR